MWCDTHTCRLSHPKCFFPSFSQTNSHNFKLWFISSVRARTHTDKIMNPSLTTHTVSAGRIDFKSAGLMRGRKTVAHLSPHNPLLICLIHRSEGWRLSEGLELQRRRKERTSNLEISRVESREKELENTLRRREKDEKGLVDATKVSSS